SGQHLRVPVQTVQLLLVTHHPVLIGPHAGEDRGPAHRCHGRGDSDVGQGGAPPASALSKLGQRRQSQPACGVVPHPVPPHQQHLGSSSFMRHRVSSL